MPRRASGSARKVHPQIESKRQKPIDRWLALAGVAVGVILFLLPKTPSVVCGAVALIFLLLVHPVWHFWWIEKSAFRRVFACLLLSVALVGLGYSAWPLLPPPVDEPHFAALVTTPIPPGDTSTAFFWFAYDVPLRGRFISPSEIQAYFLITNLRPRLTKIIGIDTEVETLDGNWMKLTRLDPRIGTIYYDTSGDRKKAIANSIYAGLESALQKQTSTGESVEGITFFEFPIKAQKIHPSQSFRLTLTEASGESSRIVARRAPSNLKNGVGIRPLGAPSDISARPVKNFAAAPFLTVAQ